jgi:hypothetical protein
MRSAALAAGLALAGCSAPSKPAGADVASRSIGTDQLSGIGRSQVVALLGPADFHRKDGLAEIMQYRNSSCILDVFLYAKTGSGEAQVHYVEAHDQSMKTVSSDNCLNTVLQSRGTRTS